MGGKSVTEVAELLRTGTRGCVDRRAGLCFILALKLPGRIKRSGWAVCYSAGTKPFSGNN
jgi:hypothetical protein